MGASMRLPEVAAKIRILGLGNARGLQRHVLHDAWSL